MASRQLDFATRIVHSGERQKWPSGMPVATPIYASSTFTYDSMEDVDKVFSGEKPGYVYSRYGNPTVAALEQAVQDLEGGAAACAYASGMAALHAALLACELSPGSTVLASQNLYGATLDLMLKVFGLFEVKTVTLDLGDLEQLRASAAVHQPRAVIAETISNPLLKICDISACAEVAHCTGAKLVIDNTFSTPYLCRPLEHGADLVVHSATKYLGGHADAMGGLVIAREASDHATLAGIMKLTGGILGPWEAHEILRGLKTLAVRMDRQCANARSIAEELARDPRVARVHYPGMAPDSSSPRLRGLLRSPHAGAMVAIELGNDSREAAFRFMNALKLCVRSTSLGDVFTSALHPATSSHRDMAPARRRLLGIHEGLIRISAGIEEVADILADLHQALDAVSTTPEPNTATIESP